MIAVNCGIVQWGDDPVHDMHLIGQVKGRMKGRNGIFLALIAAASLLLQPICGAFAAATPAAMALSQADAEPKAHRAAAGRHAPKDASCCSVARAPALAGPPATRHGEPLSGPSAATAFASSSQLLAPAWTGTRTDVAWATDPPPRPFHSRSSRILR